MPITSEIFRVSPNLTPAISIGFNAWIDFRIWVLEHDHLQVSPFVRHLPATGALQAQGLTPQVWQACLNEW